MIFGITIPGDGEEEANLEFSSSYLGRLVLKLGEFSLMPELLKS